MTGAAGCGGHGVGAHAAAVLLPHKSHLPRSEKKTRLFGIMTSVAIFLAGTHPYIHTHIHHTFTHTHDALTHSRTMKTILCRLAVQNQT